MAITIGIIGADDRGVTIAKALQACGHHVTFSDPHGDLIAQRAADAVGGDAKACTTYDQAASSDMLVLAIHWEDLDDSLRALGDYKDGIVIDAIRPPTSMKDASGAEVLAKKLDNRHVVKAFVDVADPKDPIRIASDDPEARMTVEELIRSCGREAQYTGSLAEASDIEREYAQKHTTI